MTYQEFYTYFYKNYWEAPLTARVDQQAKTIFHLKMEIAKLKKQYKALSDANKEEQLWQNLQAKASQEADLD